MGNLVSAVDELLVADVRSQPDAALADEVLQIRAQINRLEAAYLDRVAVLDRRGVGDAEHNGSTAGWLRWHCRLSPGSAGRDVHLSRACVELTVTREALGAGCISVSHAELIASLCRDLPDHVVKGAEAELVAAAELNTPAQFRRFVAGVRHAYAKEAVVRDEQQAHQERALHGSTTFRGTGVGNWTLPPVLHETVMTAIHAFSKPHPGDDRSPKQRRADALVTICEIALACGQAPEAGGVKPHVTVIGTLGGLADIPGEPPADYAYGATSSNLWLQRLACDADVSRVVFGPNSEPLDAGRAVRTFTAAQRRVIVARDLHCIWPGCDAPAGWCEAHHPWWFSRGGPTSVHNGVLLCGRHHDRVHLYGHAILKQPDGHYTVDLRPASDPDWTGPPRAGP